MVYTARVSSATSLSDNTRAHENLCEVNSGADPSMGRPWRRIAAEDTFPDTLRCECAPIASEPEVHARFDTLSDTVFSGYSRFPADEFPLWMPKSEYVANSRDHHRSRQGRT